MRYRIHTFRTVLPEYHKLIELCSPSMRPACRSLFLFVAVLLPGFRLQAQGALETTPDSSASGMKFRPLVIPGDNLLWAIDSTRAYDSGFADVHLFSPLHRRLQVWQDLGHAGSPGVNLLPTALTAAGWRSGFNAYQQLVRGPIESSFIARNPFSSFHYSQGNQGQIFLNAFHTQNISPGWNVAIDYQSLQSQGLYEYAIHQQRYFRFASLYRSPNRRYTGRFTANWNRITRNENYGLADSARFFNETLPIFVPRSTSAGSAYRNTLHTYRHDYRLGKDSTSPWFLYNELRWSREQFEYNDNLPQDTLYSLPPLRGPGAFDDSFRMRSLEQESGLLYSDYRGMGSGRSLSGLLVFGSSAMRVGGFNMVAGRYFNTWYRALLGQGLAGTRALSWQMEWQQFTGGYNAGDYRLDAKAGWRREAWVFAARATQQRSRPAFTDNFFYSNRYHWKNDFRAMAIAEIEPSLQYRHKGFQTGIAPRFGRVDRLVYIAANGLPAQADNATGYGDIHLHAGIEKGHLFMQHHLHRLSSSQRAVMPLPEWAGRHNFGYTGTWFKGVLKVRAGVDLWWTSRFTAYAYLPATGRFGVQNNLTTGGYPAADVYFSGAIKQVHFFVKMEHVNEGWLPARTAVPYWSSAGYVLEPRRMRLGLRWAFYN